MDEAQARFSDLLDLIAVGEEVVIMDKGEPVAKLVPILPTEQKPRKLSSAPQKANSPFPMISTIPRPRRSKIVFGNKSRLESHPVICRGPVGRRHRRFIQAQIDSELSAVMH